MPSITYDSKTYELPDRIVILDDPFHHHDIFNKILEVSIEDSVFVLKEIHKFRMSGYLRAWELESVKWITADKFDKLKAFS